MPKGTEYVDVLGSSIRNQVGKIYYETTAHTLLTDDNGAVNGVVCQQTDGTNAAAEQGRCLTKSSFLSFLIPTPRQRRPSPSLRGEGGAAFCCCTFPAGYSIMDPNGRQNRTGRH